MSAFNICATLAASLSLSPYLISDVAVVSFSFTIGMPLIFIIFSIVSLALSALLLSSVSSRVNKICPTLSFFLKRAFLNRLISSICPIADTA